MYMAVVAMLLTSLTATTPATVQAQTTSIYDNITYTWKDATGAEHVAKLSDPATDPEQMKYLAVEIWKNKNVPGTIYLDNNWYVNGKPIAKAWYEFGPQQCVVYAKRGDELYLESTIDGEVGTYLGEKYKNYGLPYVVGADYTPNKEGLTALLVELDDTYRNEKITDFDEAWTHIKRISVIPQDHQTRVGSGNKVGYLLNINKPLNKFFVMLKGNVDPFFRYSNHGELVPFYEMYEQLSPSYETGEKDAEGNDIMENLYDGYDKMLKGEKYPVNHLCGSVLTLGHAAMMGKEKDQDLIQSNMLVYIPDYRFAGAFNNEDDGYGNYSKDLGYGDLRPYFYFYTINLDVPSYKPERGVKACPVKLTWTSSQKSITADNNAEEFYVYRRVNGGEWELVPASKVTVTQSGTTQDATKDRYVRSQDGTVTITVAEELMDYEQYIDYKVLGRVADTNFDFVESNTQQIMLPIFGDNQYLDIDIRATHSSVFDAPNQCNHYNNVISMVQESANLPEKPLTINHIGKEAGKGIDMHLVRFVNPTGSPKEADGVRIATIEVRYVQKNTTIIVGNPWHELKATVKDADGTTTGTFTWESNEWRHKKGEVVRLADAAPELFTFTDSFDWSTEEHADHNRYVYRLFIYGIKELPEDVAEPIASSYPGFKMPASDIDWGVVSYTAEEIAGDYDHHLPLSTPACVVTLGNDARDEYVSVCKPESEEVHIEAHRGQGGEYSFMTRNADGNLTMAEELLTPVNFGGDWKVPMGMEMQNEQLVLTLHRKTDVADKYNTYGTPRVTLPAMPSVDIFAVTLSYNNNGYNVHGQFKPMVMTKGRDRDWMTGAETEPEIDAMNDALYNHDTYGAWRNNESLREPAAIDNTVHHRDVVEEGRTLDVQALPRLMSAANAAPSLSQNSHMFDDRVEGLAKGTTAKPAAVWYKVRNYSTLVKDPAQYVISQTVDGWSERGNGGTTGADDLEGDAAGSAFTVTPGITPGEYYVTANAAVTVADINGHIILQLPAGDSKVNISDYPAGMYIFTDGTDVEKVMKH